MRRLVRPTRPGSLVLVTRNVDRDPAVALMVTLVKNAFVDLQRLVDKKLSD